MHELVCVLRCKIPALGQQTIPVNDSSFIMNLTEWPRCFEEYVDLWIINIFLPNEMYSSYISVNVIALYSFQPKHYENCENLWVHLEKRLFKVAQIFTGKTITKINIDNTVIKNISIFKGEKVIFKEDILNERILKMDLFLFFGSEWVMVFLSPSPIPLLLSSRCLTFHWGGWCDSSCSARPLLTAMPIKILISFFLLVRVKTSQI